MQGELLLSSVTTCKVVTTNALLCCYIILDDYLIKVKLKLEVSIVLLLKLVIFITQTCLIDKATLFLN